MNQDTRAHNLGSVSHLQRNVAARDALRKKINRVDADTELWLANKAATHGIRLSNDPHLLDDGGIPVLHRVHIPQPAKVAPIRPRANTKTRPADSECTFGDCRKNPDCTQACPNKPSHFAAHIAAHARASAKSHTGPNCAPGTGFQGKATCSDHQCPGHPSQSSMQDGQHVDPEARAFFWRSLLGAVAIVALIFAGVLASV